MEQVNLLDELCKAAESCRSQLNTVAGAKSPTARSKCGSTAKTRNPVEVFDDKEIRNTAFSQSINLRR